MKKIIFVLAMIIAVISCKTEVKKSAGATKTSEIPFLAIGEFDVKAGEFVNKEVKVQGIVDHVCKHSGKKILLVSDEGDIHITADERFDAALTGSEIAFNGIVVEERIDESYCLKMEDDNIKSHSEGASNEAQFEAKKKHIQTYRDQMKAENTDHISLYTLKYVSHSVIE
ncbi:MAG: hypothetical protein Q8S41_07240 [Lutibacter sp.]|nr:hypothetical protein [Lutibacter sp.]